MKLNKVASIFALVIGMSSSAVYADAGSGRVTFTGSIVDAACSVNPDSSDQEVDLGQIAASELAGGGMSTPRNFEILLENCQLGSGAGAVSGVTVTFGGAAADATNKLLGITGTAAGAGVAITDGSGSQITLGTPTASRTLITGNNTLNFSAYAQGIAATITEGDFQAVADFVLDYQ